MTSYSQPRQVLPSWLSYASVTVPLGTGSYSISLTVVELPQTYYGPPIPLPSDGSWVWGGYTSPGPSTSTPTPTCSPNSCSTSFSISISSILPPTVAPTFTSTSPPISSPLPTSSPTTTSPSSSIFSSSLAHPPTGSNTSHSSGLSGTEIGLVAGLVGGLMVLLISALCCFAFWRKRRSRRTIAHLAGFDELGEAEEGDWEFVTKSDPRLVERSPFARLTPHRASHPIPSPPFGRDSLVASVEGATIGYVTGRARREMPTVAGASRDSGSTDYGEELSSSIAARSGDRPAYRGLPLDNVEDIPEDPASSSASPIFSRGDRSVEHENLLDNGRNGDSRGGGTYNTHSFRALVGVLESYFQGRNSGWLSSLSQRLSRPASEKNSNGSQESRKSAKSHSIPLSDHPSQLGEKSEYVAARPDIVQAQESTGGRPATLASDAFPMPPDTFGRMHGFFRRRRSRSHSGSLQSGQGGRSTRPVSGYSAGAQSVASGQTVFHDALEQIPDTQEAHSPPQVFFARSDYPHPIPQVKSMPPLSSLFSMRSTGFNPGPIARRTPSPSPRIPDPQPTPLDFDVLDEPAPLPSVVLQPPREGSVPSMSSRSHSFTGLSYQLPPGLEDHGSQPLFNISPDSGYAFSSDLVNLESEPPSAAGDWQRISSIRSLSRPNRGVTVEHNGTLGHFRRETLGQIVFHETEMDRRSESSGRLAHGYSRSRSQSNEEDYSPDLIPHSIQSSLSSRVPGVSVPRPSLSTFGSRPPSLPDAEPNRSRP